jgi:hypothetical protein
VVVAAVILIMALCAPRDRQESLGDGRTVSSYRFDLSTCLVPQDRIVAAGFPRDGLLALDDPPFMPAGEVERRNADGRGKFLVANDRVVGVAIAGDARAYPLRLLRWHEVVNDTVGGVPILVTYNPLCDAVVVAERRIQAEAVEFGVSGLLYNSNLLLYDRSGDAASASLWSQLQGRAVAGPAAAHGLRLRLLPAAVASWGDWFEQHPDTRVLAPLDRMKSLYKRNPYHSYFGSDLLRFPVSPLPPSDDIPLKERVTIVSVGDEHAVFALTRLAAAVGRARGVWHDELAGMPFEIRFDSELGTATVEPTDGTPTGFAVRHAFWFAWHAMHPDTGEPLP